jgi:hypothetical protein
VKSQLKVIGFIFTFLVFSQSVANADFEYDFAPSQWTYTETTDSAYGPSGTLTGAQMQLTSANHTDWSGTQFGTTVQDQVGSYAITIPMDVVKISFSYEYSTGDVSGSPFDMAQYTLAGDSTDLVPVISQTSFNPSLPQNGYGAVVTSSGTKTIDVSGKQGKTFSIDQLCNDCVLGSATITITSFNVSRIRYSAANVVLSDIKPTITADSKGYSCKPGTYSFLQYGITKISAAPTSLVYTLIVNGIRVSAVSSDNWEALSKSVFDTSNKSVSGVASAASATWLVEGANTKSAQCEVVAFQDGATAISYSSNS